MRVDTILDRFQEIALRERRHDPLALQRIGATLVETECPAEQYVGIQEHYKLTLSAYTTYWANQAQIRDARRRAERAILAILYGDVVNDLLQLRSMLDDCSREAAQKAICDMISALRAD